MTDWRWSDRNWQERTGSDPEQVILEALRRAVDIRDQGVTPRATLLVAVLNDLCDAMQIEVGDLWAL